MKRSSPIDTRTEKAKAITRECLRLFSEDFRQRLFSAGERTLRIDLDTGNIFRDAFPFLFPFRYEYPFMPKINSTLRIRELVSFTTRRSSHSDDGDQMKTHINRLTGISEVAMGKPGGKPRPIFEVRYHDRPNFNIYEDGSIEGFPEGAMICNRIPAAIGQKIKRDRMYYPADIPPKHEHNPDYDWSGY